MQLCSKCNKKIWLISNQHRISNGQILCTHCYADSKKNQKMIKQDDENKANKIQSFEDKKLMNLEEKENKHNRIIKQLDEIQFEYKSNSLNWKEEICKILKRIKKDEFTLDDVYFYEKELSVKFPENKHIQAKIRQQLQILRDEGIIRFTDRGKYIKTNYDKSDNKEFVKTNTISSHPINLKQNIWLEKTIVKGRRDRELGEYSLGKALWSPQRAKGNRDIYSNMRDVRPGDIILHLVDNSNISGISNVSSELITTFYCLTGTEWDDKSGQRPGYLIRLENFKRFLNPIKKEDILSKKHKDELLIIKNEGHNVFYTKDLKLVQGAYLTRIPNSLFNIICEEYKRKNISDLQLLNKYYDNEILHKKEYKIKSKISNYNQIEREIKKDITQLDHNDLVIPLRKDCVYIPNKGITLDCKCNDIRHPNKAMQKIIDRQSKK